MQQPTITFDLRVRDIPGVLVRIAHVFARRGFNIRSLRVEPIADTHWSKMTIVTTDAPQVSQITLQLEKLVDVDTVKVHS